MFSLPVAKFEVQMLTIEQKQMVVQVLAKNPVCLEALLTYL